MHYDNTYNRLKTLNEYTKDTEDLVRGNGRDGQF